MYRGRAPQLGGIWDVIKDVGGQAVDIAGDIWGGDGEGDTGVRDVISEGIETALDVIRNGTRQQVAQVLESNMPAEMRQDLERAYMERRAREFAPLAIVGVLALVVLLRRRR